MTKLPDGSETNVSPLVIEVMENCGMGPSSNELAIGKRFIYEDNDCEPHIVEITSGKYMGTYGLSNHWWWRTVAEDGSLTGPEEHGCNNGEKGRKFRPVVGQAKAGRAVAPATLAVPQGNIGTTLAVPHGRSATTVDCSYNTCSFPHAAGGKCLVCCLQC